MTRVAAKLLILFALLAMPLGMSAASAGVPMDHGATDHTSMSGCADAKPSDGGTEPGIAACTMACAAALPAIGQAAAAPRTLTNAPRTASALKRLAGVLLETATPPPRAA